MPNGIGKKTLYPGGLTKVQGEVVSIYPVTGSLMTNLRDVKTVALGLTPKGVEKLIGVLAKSLRLAGSGEGKMITVTGHRFKNTVTVTVPKGS